MHNPLTAMPRRARRAERGQVIPIVAIASVALFGATALAADLSVQSHYRRNLQNVTDSAALAGAQDLIDPNSSASSVQTGRQNAAIDALKVLHTQLSFPTNNANYATQWVQNPSCVPDGSVCDVDNLSLGNGFTVSIDVPPKHEAQYGSAAYNDSHYIEVTLTETSKNFFGGALGNSSGTQGAHAIAYHRVPGIPFGFSLYANSVVSDGNEDEVIYGNVYAYRNIDPQSNGKSSFCVARLSNGTGGNVVFGSPQDPEPVSDPAVGPEQWDVSPANNGQVQAPDYVQTVDSCANVTSGSGWVYQTGTDARAGRCPSDVQGLSLNGSNSTFADGSNLDPAGQPYKPIMACVARGLQPPALSQPQTTNFTNVSSAPYCWATQAGAPTAYQPGYYSCGGSNQSALVVDRTLKAGTYDIKHNPNCTNLCADVVFDGLQGNIAPDTTYSRYATECPSSGYQQYACGVTFIMEPGATVLFQNKAVVSVVPYDPPSPTGNDGRYPIYCLGACTVTVAQGTIGGQPPCPPPGVTLQGTLYAPTGNVSVQNNAYLYVQGQVIVNQWSVQSGNHCNPDIVYDPPRVATEQEVLRIVE